MRSLYLIMIMAVTTGGMFSCKKHVTPIYPVSSLIIVNASYENDSIIATSSDTLIPFYKNFAPITYGSYIEYGFPAGKIPLTLVSSADTSRAFFQASLNLGAGDSYSLYIAGQSKTEDTVFMQEIIPVHNDSSSGLRFINMSPGSLPISINLQGNYPGQPEFPGIGYKQITNFKSYLANLSVGGVYNFEVRDQQTGTLLTSFSWYYTLQKNNTLVISGSEDPTSPFPVMVFQVNNF